MAARPEAGRRTTRRRTARRPAAVARRGWSAAARRRQVARRKHVAAAGALAALLLTMSWSRIWPYVTATLLLGAAGAAGWWLWRTDRLARAQERRRLRSDLIAAGRRTLTEVDAMTGTEFEELVADLCRRDGCIEVRRVGGSHDNGADVVGRLPDGRTMVIQCKRYRPTSAIASRELRDLLGARVHFGADVAVFVTTTRFSGPSERFAVQNGILAVHRDHLGLWNNGTPLTTLAELNGTGQGDTHHHTRWKQAYGD